MCSHSELFGPQFITLTRTLTLYVRRRSYSSTPSLDNGHYLAY